MKVPNDVVDGMKQLDEDSGESFDIIKAEFKKVFEEKYLESFEEPERCRQAAFIVKARRVNSLRSDGEWYEGKMISVGKTQTKQTKDKETGAMRDFVVGSAYAVMAKADSEGAKIMLTEITFFDEGTKTLDEGVLEVNKCYKIKLSGGEEGGMLKLRTSVRPSVQEIALDIADAHEIIPQIYKVTPLAEAPLNPSKGFGDKPKLIRGRVLSARINTTKKSGKDLGFYNISDDSIGAGAYATGSTRDFTVMCAPELVQFDAGSDVYFLGRISEETDEYSASMFADAVIPVLGIPLERGVSSRIIQEALPDNEKAETIDMSDIGEDEEF